MSGTGVGTLRSSFDPSIRNLHQYSQRGTFISRETMYHKLEGPSSTLHMATDVHSSQLALASRSIFKIFNIKDEGEISGPG